MQRTHSYARLLLLASSLTMPLAAQQFIETFTYPNGPTIPGWTVQNTGNWSILNGHVTKTGGTSPDFLTKDGILAKNCVLDVEVFYGSIPGVQHGGLTARHPGTSAMTPRLFAKIQDNGGANDLDIVFLYENSTASSGTVTPPVLTAVIRMIVLDTDCWVLVDGDKDGVFEMTVGPKPLTVVLSAGSVGCSITSSCELDNFKYYDGVLSEKPASPPKIGTTYAMRFATPAPQNTLWFAGLSLSNTGVPLGQRAIPLAADALLNVTLGNAAALGLMGRIDVNGDGHLAFPIPNNPALVGLPLFAGAFTLDGTQPYSIGVISQDLRFVLQS